MKVVYLSGPYSSPTPEKITENIQNARRIAIELWEAGYACICPHLNTANFEEDSNLEYNIYLEGDIAIIKGVDALVMMPTWRKSKGANLERNFALQNNIPVYEYPNFP